MTNNIYFKKVYFPKHRDRKMEKYIKSISKNLPSNIVLLKAGDNIKCPVEHGYPRKAWTSVKESDQYDPTWSNYAMLTGSKSGIWVLDIDNKGSNVSDMFDWFYEHDFDPEEESFTVKTPSGGYHIYFKHDIRVESYKTYNKYNDIQSNGQCVIFIGSEYPKGSYELINDVPITNAPEFIINAIINDNKLPICNSFTKEIDSSESDDITPEIQSVCSDFDIIQTKSYDCLRYCTLSEKIHYISEFCNIISPNRITPESGWYELCMILKNELGDTDEAYDIFLDTSRRDVDGYKRVHNGLSKSKAVKHKWDTHPLKESEKLKRLGTLIDWCKEDNLAKYEKIKKQLDKKNQAIEKENKKIEKEKKMELDAYLLNMKPDSDNFINRFIDDDFTMIKFLRYLDNTIFSNKLEAYEYVRDNLHKVCCLVGLDTLVIKNSIKNDNDQILFKSLEKFPDILIKTEDYDPMDKLTLNKILFNNRNFICRYEILSTDIVYKGNTDELFYIARPYIARRVDYKIEDLNFILEFIKNTVCSSNEDIYKSLILWLAWIVQNPDDKTGVVPVLISREGGTGKSMFIKFIGEYIIGNHLYLPVQDVKGITGEQNKYLLGKKLVYVNEMAATKESYMSQFQKFKGLITEDKFPMKALYNDPIKVKQSLEFILTANHVNCIPKEKGDTKRRFFAIRFNKHRKNDFKYFDLFTKTVLNNEYGNKFYSYLMDIQNVTYESVADFPETKLDGEMRDNQMTSYDSFMNDIFDYQLMHKLSRYIKDEHDIYHVPCMDLYDDYVEYQKHLYSSEKTISYKKFVINIKSEDNEYNVSYVERVNGHDKTKFLISLPRVDT